MHESKRQIGVKLAAVMKANGYRKRNLSWHKQLIDTILVFHGEKNRWGANNFSFHCGIYLRNLGDELTPPYYRCPIQAYLEDLVPDKFECRQICDFDSTSYTLYDRLEKIAEYVSTTALPWLEMYSTLSALRQLSQNYESIYPRVRIWRVVLDYLRN